MKKKTQKLPQLKKQLRDFLTSEEGKITKKDILKIGLSLIALSLMLPSEGAAQHTSGLRNDASQGRHVSHSSHGSHGSHGSHCNGIHNSGW